MRRALAFSPKEIIASVMLSSVITLCIGVMTRTEVSADPHAFTIVVGTNKGDRLPQVRTTSQVLPAPFNTEITGTAKGFPMKAPFGCDPAFSPIAAPLLAHISKRCMV
jgi:hypothetical protein